MTQVGAEPASSRDLLARMHRLDRDDPRRAEVRDEVAAAYLPLVRGLARRYRGRGEPVEDLVQTGVVGLLTAIDRYDPERGTEFSTFATPFILGQIKHHFRDQAWAVRVPRRLQELSARAMAHTDSLTADLGRSPTVRELADSLGVDEEEVLEAIEAHHALAADPLVLDGEADAAVEAAEAGIDPAFEAVEDRETLRPLLAALPARERQILTWRFADGLSQDRIAAALGISQMQVSRLLARTLADLRAGLQAA